MKKKFRIKKWIIIYSLISIIAFILFVFGGTTYLMRRAVILEPTDQETLAYQLVNTKYGSELLIWKVAEGEPRVVSIGKDKNWFQILDTEYYNEQIFMQYQYQNLANRTVYGIARYDVKKDRLSLFDMLTGSDWCAFGEKNEKLYFLMNDREGKKIQEYAVLTKNIVECELEQEIPYPKNSYIIDAAYHNNTVNMCLDNGTAYYISGSEAIYYKAIEDSPFVQIRRYDLNQQAKALWEREIRLAFVKKMAIWWFLGSVLGGLGLAAIIGRCSMIVKLFVWTECVLLFMMAVMSVSLCKQMDTAIVESRYEKGDSILQRLPKFYDASGMIEYQTLYTQSKLMEIPFEEIIILDREENTVISQALRTPANVVTEGDGYYGKRFSNLVNALTTEKPLQHKQITDGYITYQVILYKDTTNIDKDRVLIGFIDSTVATAQVETVLQSILGQVIPIWLCVNVLMIFIILMYQIRWRRFSKALLLLVKKHEKYEEKKRVPNELIREWKALDEVYRIISRTQYEKAQNLGIYNQFMPKGIEKALGKNSLLDLELGDKTEVQGSMVTISLDDTGFEENQVYLDTLQQAFAVVHNNMKEKEGIMITQDSSLANTKVLFRENLDAAILFAIETLQAWDSHIHMVDKDKIFVLNYAQYQCGMTGSAEHLLPYVYTKEDRMVSTYMEALRRAGVKLVLTEQAVAKCDSKYVFRYIGFITGNGKNIKLFECLNAYSNIKKELLMDTANTFKKALGLFYSNDFYLARNTFNEVLKENPDDKIARWYLFNCEHNLNLASEQVISYGLFENRIYEQQYQQR